MFNTAGTVKTVDVPGVGKVEETPAALRPFSEAVDEIFKIKNGQIDSIVAVMTGLPFGATSGWPQKSARNLRALTFGGSLSIVKALALENSAASADRGEIENYEEESKLATGDRVSSRRFMPGRGGLGAGHDRSDESAR